MEDRSCINAVDMQVSLEPWLLKSIGNFDYIAAMTRRCPNWIDLKIQEGVLKKTNFTKLLTENGLLMQAEDIAEYFQLNGRFPRIALLDDVLVHGRSLNSFLHTLLELLAACLGVNDPEDLQDALCKSISIFVIMANDAPVLLKREYRWEMQFESIGREDKWRELSHTISEDIYQADIANTSYIISAKLPARLGNPQVVSVWDMVNDTEIPYRKGRQWLYVHELSRNKKVYPAVRTYVRGDSRYYTPYFFCGTLSDRQITQMLKEVSSCLDDFSQRLFAPFLKLTMRAAAYKQRKSVYFQLINLLLGQITLQRFWDDANLPLQYDMDTEKIARNFGFSREIVSCLDNLCAIQWPGNILDLVCDALEIPAHNKDISSYFKMDSTDKIRSIMDLVIYIRAVQHEAYAKSLEREFAAGRYTANIKITGEYLFEELFSIAFVGLKTLPWEHKTTLLMLAYLTQIMDRGDISLKARARYDPDRGQYLYESSFRNTEMSLSILPRDLGSHFPVFVLISKLYRHDEDFPDVVKDHFENLLVDNPRAKEIILTAKIFAKILNDHSSMSDTLLEWKQHLLGD